MADYTCPLGGQEPEQSECTIEELLRMALDSVRNGVVHVSMHNLIEALHRLHHDQIEMENDLAMARAAARSALMLARRLDRKHQPECRCVECREADRG